MLEKGHISKRVHLFQSTNAAYGMTAVEPAICGEAWLSHVQRHYHDL